jgi:hypothetical protein
MPAEVLPWIRPQFFDDDGVPVSLGTLSSFIAGTSTPAATYTDSDLGVANPVVIDLDASGLPPDPIFLAAHGYKFELADADAVVLATYDNIENVGQVWTETYGEQQTEGSLNVATGYTVVATDRFVTMGSAGGNILLPAASDFTASITLKNMSTTTAMTVTPNGSDTIDGIAALYSVAASTSPTFKTITLISNGVDAWWIQSSHGV